MYVTANTCTELSAPVLDSTKLQQSAAAWNLNAKCPPINGSGFSPNNGCTIQQKLPHNWWNVNQCRKKLKTAKHVWWMTNFPDGHQKPHNTECAYTTISLCWVLLSPTGSAAFIYEGWLISKVSYREVSLVVGRTKRLRMRSVVDTV
jgi:hypothetical protein